MILVEAGDGGGVGGFDFVGIDFQHGFGLGSGFRREEEYFFGEKVI